MKFNFPMPNRFEKQTPMHIPRPKYIIIHNTRCIAPNDSNIETDLDSKKYQYPTVKFLHIKKMKFEDVQYHYILEKIGGDYEIIVGKPFHIPCVFNDIQDVYFYSIHIALLGDYNIDIPDRRLFNTLAYRLITPLMYWFNLNVNNVITHKQASNNPDINCPGEFFFIQNLKSAITRFKSNK